LVIYLPINITKRGDRRLPEVPVRTSFELFCGGSISETREVGRTSVFLF